MTESQEWSYDSDILFLSSKVRSQNRLTVPEQFREICFDDYPDDPSTFWVYSDSESPPFISKSYRNDDDLSTTGIYDLNDGSWIQIAKEAVDNSNLDDLEEGSILYFFTKKEFLESGIAYILTAHAIENVLRDEISSLKIDEGHADSAAVEDDTPVESENQELIEKLESTRRIVNRGKYGSTDLTQVDDIPELSISDCLKRANLDPFLQS